MSRQGPHLHWRPDRQQVLTALVLALTVGGVVLPFWPGLISADANMTLWEAQTGVTRDWYSPFLSIVSGVLLDLHLGVGSIFLLQTVLAVAGAFLCARLFLDRVAAAVTTAALCAFPPVYAQLSGLSRDMCSAGFALLSFGLFGKAMASRAGRRGALASAAVAAAIGSFLARQNSIVLVLVLVVVLAWLALVDPSWRPARLATWRLPRSRWSQGAVSAAAGVIASGFVFGAAMAINSQAGVLQLHPERQLFVYDLAAISTSVNRDLFPPELDEIPRNAIPRDLSLPALEERFDYRNVITLYPDGDWIVGDLEDESAADAEADVLQEAWISAVRDEPGAYLGNRGRLLLSQLGLVSRPLDGFYGLMDGSNYEHPLRFEGGYRAAKGYVEAFVGPKSVVPLDVAWIYLVAASGSLVFLVKRRGRGALPATLMVASIWFTVAGLSVLSMGASFRYMNLAVPLAFLLSVDAVVLAVRTRDAARDEPDPRAKADRVGDDRDPGEDELVGAETIRPGPLADVSDDGLLAGARE